MPPAGSQTANRRQIAIKHSDGEPLTRSDLQYDFLYYLFSDTLAVFTDPYTTLQGDAPGTKVTFRDLYVNALVHSPHCSKVSQNKLLETPQFAEEFAKISLLSNINRINTTMAFFPEMRTALRTYHPVPSLQKTDGTNLQDAPRIKHLLKACLLPEEKQEPPLTTAEVLNRIRAGMRPPTSIVNLIFVFQSQSSILAQAHFPPSINYELQDFFTPISISSESRARAFLWLCYHYYEGSSPNPYDDSYSEQHSGMIPRLYSLSPEEARLENVDTPDEKAWGEKMTAQRALFMENKDKPLPASDAPNAIAEGEVSGPKPKTARRGRGGAQSRGRGVKDPDSASSRSLGQNSSTPKPSRAQDDSSSHVASPVHGKREKSSEGSGRVHCADSLQPLPISQDVDRRLSPTVPPFTSPLIMPPHMEPTHRDEVHHSPRRLPSLTPEPYPSRRTAVSNGPPESTSGGPIRHNRRIHRTQARLDAPAIPSIDSMESYSSRPARRLSIPLSPYSPTDPRPSHASHSHLIPISHRQTTTVIPLHSPSSIPQPRTMLEQAWHVVMSTDPLADSEDEQDENTRLDLLLRLRIINRLRGKEPTPEPELAQERVAQADTVML